MAAIPSRPARNIAPTGDPRAMKCEQRAPSRFAMALPSMPPRLWPMIAIGALTRVAGGKSLLNLLHQPLRAAGVDQQG